MTPAREPLPVWYETPAAINLLRDCVRCPPPLAPAPSDWREGPRVDFFDRADPRVARLHAIVRDHFAQALSEPNPRARVEAAGMFYGVDMVIDAVLPRPVAGCANDPEYLAALPSIDLGERAAA